MKFFRSIRTKLTLWYTIIVAATLCGFGVISYFYTEDKLLENLDLSLQKEVGWLKNFIEPQARKVKLKKHKQKLSTLADTTKKNIRRTNEVEIVQDSTETEVDVIWNQIYEHALLSPKKQIIQIRDRNGDILYKLNSPEKEDLFFEDIPFNTTKLVTLYDSKGQPLRLAVTQNTFAKIYVAYPESEVTEVLGNLFSIFLILLPSALLISLLGGWFLANKSLKPVDDITKTARAITAQNLDERIARRSVDDELGRLISTFNEMISRLQNSFEQIQQFSIDVSHELRTPLAIIRGEIELALRSKQTQEKYAIVLSSTLDEVLRLTSIIENLLTLAKADTGKSVLQIEKVSLINLLKELYEDSVILASTKDIIVSLKISENTDIFVFGDAVRLRQLFLNLIDNAIKYTPKNGSISISLIQENNKVKVIIEDTGIGIPLEEQNKIFDRFYRVDKGRSREMGGTGLGLSISKWIAEVHSGGILLQSEVGKGSIFTVVLPISNT